jgi:DNA primase
LPASITAEIKSKLDIVEVVGESVPLKKAGASYKGLCPFHGERTPSFVVTPARESWHCFGCGLGGDVFSFVMQRESVDFPEALKRLAARAGVELDERTTREDARRKRLRAVLESAIAFYHQVLTSSRHGQPALDYLRGRGFTDATIETFQLGWAPDAWDTLSHTLIAKRGMREDELEAVGLAVRGRRPGVYDRFRGRIIFPIRDASGGATGLGGRILDVPGAGKAAGDNGRLAASGSEPAAARDTGIGSLPSAAPDRGPKYLNSPATPLFDKSRTLYLVDRARGAMRKTHRAVIVEGYTDALMAHQSGFTNVVGGLGTALTAGQVELVTRYASEIALAYDVDPAGQHAGTFGATELTALIGEIGRSGAKIGLTEVGVVRLPEGKDPDEVIRDDPATWESAVAEPQGIIEYLIDYHAGRLDLRTVQGRKRLVSAVLPVLRGIADPTVRDGYLQRLATRSGVEDRVLREELQRPIPADRSTRDEAAHAGGRINVDAVLAARETVDPEAVVAALDPIERSLLRLLLLAPEEQLRLRDELTDDLLPSTPARELWHRMLADRDTDAAGAFAAERFVAALDPELGLLARALLARREVPVPDAWLPAEVDRCLVRLRRRRNADEVDFVRAELAEAEAHADAAARDALRERIRTLQQARADLDRLEAATSLLHRTHPDRIAAGGPA